MANVKNNEMETTHNRKKLVLILIFIVRIPVKRRSRSG